MLKFNTTAGLRDRLHLSLEQVFKGSPRIPRTLKTSLLAAIFLCCFSYQPLYAQCTISCASPGVLQLPLQSTGNYTLTNAVIATWIGGSCTLTPPAYPEINLWEDAAATIPYPSTGTILGPVFSCNDIDYTFTLYVTVDGDVGNVCSFDFRIVDNFFPIVQFPPDDTLTADANACAVNVSGLEVDSILENCSYDVFWTRSGATMGSGTESADGLYNVGTTVIAWTVIDADTNTVVGMTTITVTDDEAPVIAGCPSDIVVSNGPDSCAAKVTWTPPTVGSDNCSDAVFTNSGIPGSNIFSVGGSPHTINYFLTDLSGNADTCTFTVTVNDTQFPEFAMLPGSQSFSPVSCEQPIMVGIGSVSDNCSSILSSETCYLITDDATGDTVHMGKGYSLTDTLGIGSFTITFSAKDDADNETTHSFTYVVNDTQEPIAVCKTVHQVSLDINGMAVLNAVDLDSLSSDNCGIDSFHIRPLPPGAGAWRDTLQYDCDDIGIDTVRFRVMDLSGNVSNPPACTTVVTIVDDLAPTAICQDITVELSPAGTVTVMDTDIDGGSFDNCTDPLTANPHFRISKDTLPPYTGFSNNISFDCTELGPNKVTLRVRDDSLNTNFCFAIVTVEDNIIPTAQAQDTCAFLNSMGMAWIDGMDIDSFSFDSVAPDPIVCGIVSYKVAASLNGPFVDSLKYTCDSLGARSIWLEVTDTGGNKDTSAVRTVMVKDTLDPVALCYSEIDVDLDATGNATITVSDIDSMSSDNCSPITRTLDITTFDCTNIGVGINTVELDVEDSSGNRDSCTTTVNVFDNVPPVAACSNLTIALQSDGKVEVFALQLSFSSFDVCSFPVFPLPSLVSVNGSADSTSYIFDCSDIGSNTATVTVFDIFGNQAICTSIVTIEDTEAPVVTAPANVTIECHESRDTSALGAATATDNCKIDTIYYSDSPAMLTACSGTITRTWTAEDSTGNTGTAVQVITVVDTTAPTFVAPVDIDLDSCVDNRTVAEFVCVIDSNNTQIPIPTASTSTISDFINISGQGKVFDVNVINLDIEHTDISDMEIWLDKIGGPSVRLFANSCPDSVNIDNVSFDDDATGGFVCPPTGIGGIFTPDQSLSAFSNIQVNGNWRLRIIDSDGSGDGGNLKGWGLEICYVAGGDTTVAKGATMLADNCDNTLNATFKDYQAFKGFASNTANTVPSMTSYDFSYSAWTKSPNSSTYFTNNTPSSITMRSFSGVGTTTLTYPSIPADGWIIFDYSFSGDNGDSFGYFVNSGTPMNLSPTSTPQRMVVEVFGGQNFGFSIVSDNDGSIGSRTISDFVYVDKSICPVPAYDCPKEFCIARLWDLTDDCGNDALTQAQIITTDDTTEPTFSLPDTMVVLATGTICTPYIQIDLSTYIVTEECWLDSITNTALADYGKGNGGASATGFYAPGIYDITFRGYDACGNIGVHELVLEVMDAQNPTAICQNITIQLDNSGNASITAANINNGSSDNCGIVDMTVSPNTFTTADIGSNLVTLTVEDDAGLTNSCPATVIVLGGVGFTAGNATGLAGGMAFVPVTVDSFNSITFFEMTLDLVLGSVGAINSIENINPALGSIPLFNAGTGLVSWFDSSIPPSGVTLAPGEKLFDVKVNISPTANVGDSSPLEIINTDAGAAGIPGSIPSFGIAGTVTVIDNSAPKTIAGNFKTEMGTDIDSVTVFLTGTVMDTVPPTGSTTYSFNMVPNGASATVTPQRDRNWRLEDNTQLVSTADVFLIHQHAALLDTLPTPYKIIAADANKSNSVTTADVFLVHQLAVGIEGPIASVNESWRFIDADQALPWPNPFSVAPFDESISHPVVNMDFLNDDFIGVKVGDVNNSLENILFWDPSSDDRSDDAVKFVINDESYEQGTEATVVFRAKDFEHLLTYQATLNFDNSALELVEAIPGNVPNLNLTNFNLTRSEEGMMAFNWYHTNAAGVDLHDGYEVFTLKFNVLEDISSLRELMAITDAYIPIEAMNEERAIIGVDLLFEGVTSTDVELEANPFKLYQNRPNPFSQSTFIGFNLPERSQATLTILDPSGRVLKVIEGEYGAGYHQVEVDRYGLPIQGVLFYRLETASHHAIRKMILLD
ncbi:MAG: HYR domain-containing protein [Bacteroidota bacterium]